MQENVSRMLAVFLGSSPNFSVMSLAMRPVVRMAIVLFAGQHCHYDEVAHSSDAGPDAAEPACPVQCPCAEAYCRIDSDAYGQNRDYIDAGHGETDDGEVGYYLHPFDRSFRSGDDCFMPDDEIDCRDNQCRRGRYPDIDPELV